MPQGKLKLEPESVLRQVEEHKARIFARDETVSIKIIIITFVLIQREQIKEKTLNKKCIKFDKIFNKVPTQYLIIYKIVV